MESQRELTWKDVERLVQRWWRFVVKHSVIIGGIIVGIAGAVSWLETLSERLEAESYKKAQDTQIAVRESQKPFLERQLEFYFEAANVTSKLAMLTPSKPVNSNQGQEALEDWNWARRRFWELYWGELAAVESLEVSKGMVDFGEDLHKLEECVDKGGDCGRLRQPLTTLSLSVAHQARSSIEKGWGYSLPLPPVPTR